MQKLQVNIEFQEIFQEPTIITYRRNTNFRQLVGGNKIKENKTIVKSDYKHRRRSFQCLSNLEKLYCEFDSFHNINCKGNGIIYLLACNLCKVGYVEKGDRSFNKRFNNHQKDDKTIRANNVTP